MCITWTDQGCPAVVYCLVVLLAGFAFVYMEDKRDGEDAIRALDRYAQHWGGGGCTRNAKYPCFCALCFFSCAVVGHKSCCLGCQPAAAAAEAALQTASMCGLVP